MKTPLTLTLAALGLAFAAQPASAAAQCAEDPSKLDSAFLIMTVIASISPHKLLC